MREIDITVHLRDGSAPLRLCVTRDAQNRPFYHVEDGVATFTRDQEGGPVWLADVPVGNISRIASEEEGMADGIEFDRPDQAPASVKARDGKTRLHRFRVEAAIMAPSKAAAQRRLEAANIFLDAARIVPDRVTAELDRD